MITSIASAVRRRMASAADADAGFTVLEVLVSFVLFAVVAASATYGIVNALQTSHTGQQRVDAANIAQAYIAATEIRTQDAQTEVARPLTAPAGSEKFAVLRWITFSTPGATQCSAGQTFTVNVTVSVASTGTFLARSDSIVAC